MPAGRTHLKIELFLLPLLLGAFWYWMGPYLGPQYQWHGLLLFGLAYLFSSLMFSPDLDLRHNSSRSNWGVLGFVWIPYTKIFKHRGMSHSLVLGTFTRLAYLGLVVTTVVFAVWAIERYLLGAEFYLPQIQKIQIDLFVYYWLGILVFGLWLPNAIHIITDHVHSAWKRR
jgi:uncharacterized metal-binding protein